MFNVFPHVQSIRQQYKDSRILLDFQWFASSCNVLCDIPTAAQHWAVEIGLPDLESPNLPSNPQSSMSWTQNVTAKRSSENVAPMCWFYASKVEKVEEIPISLVHETLVEVPQVLQDEIIREVPIPQYQEVVKETTVTCLLWFPVGEGS